MKIKELMERLSRLNPETDIMIMDGSNGGGAPRDLNLGPCEHTITEEDADDVADCEERVGEIVIVMGFGCY